MPTYEVTFTAKIKIKATNAAAAKQALKPRRLGGLKLIGESSCISSPPSKHSDLDWHWSIKIDDPKFTEFKRAP